MSYIQTIPYDQASGELKSIYDDLINKRGKLASVHMIQSLNPKSIIAHMDLYMNVMFGKSPLRRYQREMLAVIVSNTNHCGYCIDHHGAALLHFWKDHDKISQLCRDYSQLDLSEEDVALCNYAEKLSEPTATSNYESDIDALRHSGLDDRTILDATLVIAYFNFVNRIVLGLGVEVETDVGGYNYD